VVLGGDGALLSAVRAFRATPVPTLGINLGRIGFLASATTDSWRATLADVLEGRGMLEHRMRLSLRVPGAGGAREAVALNDVVVARNADESMLRLRLEVGGDWVTDYRADGLIVATPSGSTAYSLSSGGPILAPSMLGLVVTPICSQGLANRPLVLHPDSELTLRVETQSTPAALMVDGQRFAALELGRPIHVTRHPVPFPLLATRALDPFRRLRERLGWGGDVP
ncbi:MAG TPA: NAD(+)/NADH kinase, partial [Planctomycetota bacterium]|nr:NAD(+)/NADH kinase [Planctomycetota bacterium]